MPDQSAVRVQGGYVVKRSVGRVHPTFDSAGAEAARLSAMDGGAAFTILQIVGLAEPPRPREGDGPEVFEAHAAWARAAGHG